MFLVTGSVAEILNLSTRTVTALDRLKVKRVNLAKITACFLIMLLIFWVGTRIANAETDPRTALIVRGAVAQVGVTVRYDGVYHRLEYPGGDIPQDRGVCTDVILRAFREAGIDLQVLVHEDMRRNFKSYPQLWGLTQTDSNIDHRRVPNLMRFFERKSKTLELTRDASAYRPGDIIAWRLPSGLLHIGIVSDRLVPNESRYLIAHNIGEGTKLEDIVFEFERIGHYRYFE